jgi:hypothetical protein
MRCCLLKVSWRLAMRTIAAPRGAHVLACNDIARLDAFYKRRRLTQRLHEFLQLRPELHGERRVAGGDAFARGGLDKGFDHAHAAAVKDLGGM